MKNITFIISLLFVFFMNLTAQEIKLTGKYAEELVNPFLEKLGQNKSPLKILSNADSFLTAKIITNIDNNNIFNVTNNKFTYKISKNSCSKLLKLYMSQKHTINNFSNNTASCQITDLKINFQFDDTESQAQPILNDIIIDTSILLTLKENGNTILNKTITKRMNKDLNKKGQNYDFSIRTTYDFSYDTKNEAIQKIIENSIFEIFSEKLN